MTKKRVRAFAIRHAAELISSALPEPADFLGEGFTAEDRVAVYNELRLLAEKLLIEAEQLDALQ
jgi:hypothetical protein